MTPFPFGHGNSVNNGNYSLTEETDFLFLVDPIEVVETSFTERQWCNNFDILYNCILGCSINVILRFHKIFKD